MSSRTSASWAEEAFQRSAATRESGVSLPTVVLRRNLLRNCVGKESTLSGCSTVQSQSAEVMRHPAIRCEQGLAKGFSCYFFVPKCPLQNSQRIQRPAFMSTSASAELQLRQSCG